MPLHLSADKKPHRERFAGPLAIGGLAGVGLLLLVVLYPEKSLLRLLATPDVTSPAQQRYLEALVQMRDGDTELVIPLVRSYLAAGCTEKASRALGYHVRASLTSDQEQAIRKLRYELRRQELELLVAGEPGWEEARRRYVEQIEELRQAGASPRDLARYLGDARRAGDEQTARYLERLLGQDTLQQDGDSLMVAAELALGKGDYRAAAGFYFQGMTAAANRDEQRRLFLSGIRTLQSGNLLQEAVAAAQKYQQPLSGDRQTLLALTRLALAANRHDLAQQYVRRALGMSSSPDKIEARP